VVVVLRVRLHCRQCMPKSLAGQLQTAKSPVAKEGLFVDRGSLIT
jgi:hypothetical protein